MILSLLTSWVLIGNMGKGHFSVTVQLLVIKLIHSSLQLRRKYIDLCVRLHLNFFCFHCHDYGGKAGVQGCRCLYDLGVPTYLKNNYASTRVYEILAFPPRRTISVGILFFFTVWKTFLKPAPQTILWSVVLGLCWERVLDPRRTLTNGSSPLPSETLTGAVFCISCSAFHKSLRWP